MLTVAQAFVLGHQHHQAGRLAEAEALYRQILAAEPDHAEALHYLGVIAHQVGRHESAVELVRRAIALEPKNPAAYSNLGEACVALGRSEEAIAAFREAIALRPDYAQAYNNLGNALREQGNAEAAVAACRRALELKANFADAHNNLGNALRLQGRAQEAISEYRRALQINPASAATHGNLASILEEQDQIEEAMTEYGRTISLHPASFQALNNLGNLLYRRGQYEEAMAVLRQSVQVSPHFTPALNNLGIALKATGHLAEAIATFLRVLELQPEYAAAWYNLGNALKENEELDAAISALRRALELQPDYPEAHNNLGNALNNQGQHDAALAEYRRAIELGGAPIGAHSNLVYTLHFQPIRDEQAVREAQSLWNREFSEPAGRFLLPHAHERSPDRRLRIGYVSSDFREHVIGRNVLPLLQYHRAADFEIVCYSGVVRPDAMTQEFQRSAARWRETAGVADAALAEMIREDGVDILVDLAQHTSGNRLAVFAHQPAPVQVSFAGYPDSAGVEAIPCRISDRWLEPEIRNEHVFLIDSFWCYDPCGMEVAVNALPAKANGHITFGSLNNFCKVNEPVLRLWARALGKVPDSRLVMLCGFGSHRQRTVDFLASEGVVPQRVEFVAPQPRKEYFELYHRLDVVLDTFPYNGHTTSLDALWMGVPVVSLAGERPVSRAGLSQLSNLGLPELVASSEEDFVRIAVDLARDLPRVAEWRRTLRARMEASVLMDAPRFARNIEAAYRAMWRRWCGASKKHSHPEPAKQLC